MEEKGAAERESGRAWLGLFRRPENGYGLRERKKSADFIVKNGKALEHERPEWLVLS